MLGLPTITIKDRKLTLQLLWDLFMVWVALINLTLIGFDLTYLLLRPTYFRYVPVLTTLYDPALGIEAHPLTDQLIREADRAQQLLRLDPESHRLQEQLERLRVLTHRVLVENPFERSGQTRQLEVIRLAIAQETSVTALQILDPEVAEASADQFWSGSEELLRLRFDLFDRRVRPGLEINYHREYNLAGWLEDHFWLIDLPFLILFWSEFAIRWFLAVRRRTYARWFFFPIFNWYDVLGLIPMAVFRPFRLLRAVSMYMRLRRSELSRVGKDTVSRTVAYISNIITEEVSDRVALRILTEFEEEIQDGTHRRIIQSTVGSRRDEIERVVVSQIRNLLLDPSIIESFRELLQINLETAVEETDALRAIPLPSNVLRPVVTGIGRVLLDTTLTTLNATLDSPEGREAVQTTAAAIIDQLFEGPGLEELESLTREISLHVIEHMKETVAIRKWALPEDQRRTPTSLSEVADEIAAAELGSEDMPRT